MATVRWVTVQEIWCHRIQRPAALLEERVYPDDVQSDTTPYQVRSRTCSHAVECNLAGCQCQWSFLNPFYDPFDLDA